MKLVKYFFIASLTGTMLLGAVRLTALTASRTLELLKDNTNLWYVLIGLVFLFLCYMFGWLDWKLNQDY